MENRSYVIEAWLRCEALKQSIVSDSKLNNEGIEKFCFQLKLSGGRVNFFIKGDFR